MILAVSALFMLCACSDKPESLLTFHIGSSRGIGTGLSREPVQMPVSGFSVITEKDQFMYSGDLREVKLGRVKLPDGSFEIGFIFLCDQRGTSRLYQSSAANMGGFIVVKKDGQPIALRKIDGVIGDGTLFAVAEIPEDADLHKLVEEMNEQIKKVNEFKESIK